MDPRLELRRDPPTDLTDVGQDDVLIERIRDEIRAGGPMSFARFMELALYDPEGGYYRAATARPGREGDFLTAPELHPIFGATLATGIAQVWDRLGRPRPFVVREHGAGTGALALTVLDGLVADGSRLADAIRWEPVEVDERRLATFRERLEAAGHATRIAVPGQGSPPLADSIEGIVLANEVLDALPVHRVRRRGDALVEVSVGLDGDGFVEVEAPTSTPALAVRLASERIDLVDGQTAEVCLALDGWVATAAAALRRGLLLCIDYGAPAAELYDPVRRRDGTLRAYVRHQVHADPFRHVGRQDLTAHVDITAVERAARAAGLTTVGITTQAEALIGLGIEDRLRRIQADPTTSLPAYAGLRASLMRLLDPGAMGRFRVMAFGRDWPLPEDVPPLGLFAFRLPERRRPPVDRPADDRPPG